LIVREEMVPPVLLVMANIIDRGVPKLPELRKPRERSVEEAVTPLAKLYTPPEELLERMPVPLVPADLWVVSTPAAQSNPVTFPVLKPVGSVAVALVPMPSKFWGNAVPVDVMMIWALLLKHTHNTMTISNRNLMLKNALIRRFG
jgi:hypothetical protein